MRHSRVYVCDGEAAHVEHGPIGAAALLRQAAAESGRVHQQQRGAVRVGHAVAPEEGQDLHS